ncbi:lactate utilization protein [Rhodobacteraceae bacterium NNCM2]|nr:lactate utilization protein [Coraliihabitans acroporae]
MTSATNDGARNRILNRMRRAGATGAQAAERIATAGTQISPIPAQGQKVGEDAVEQFMAKAIKADATASRLDSLDDLPAALANELRNRNLPAAIRTGEDAIFDRDWGTVERSTGTGRLDEPATMSHATFGVAETGTLVFTSGPDNPVTLTFLGETHFAVVKAEDIQSGFDDMWAAWRKAGLDPRTTNLVTGPSRSGDIGQVLQLGAHGPVALHIFVVG